MTFVQAGNVRLAYSVDGSGFPVVLIAGLGGSHRQWGEHVPTVLAEKFQVIRFDNRGTGDSDKPDEPYMLDTMADEVVAVLDAAGAERAHVVGVSMGGMIAQLVALRHPARVEKLALLATSPGGARAVQPSPTVISALMPDPSRPRDEIVREAMAGIAAPGFARDSPDVVEQLVQIALDRPTPPHAFMHQMMAVLGSDRYDRLGEIAAPTLVVHGDADPLVPYGNGVLLSERIPHSQFVTLSGCGHLVMWERPTEIASELLSFLG